MFFESEGASYVASRIGVLAAFLFGPWAMCFFALYSQSNLVQGLFYSPHSALAVLIFPGGNLAATLAAAIILLQAKGARRLYIFLGELVLAALAALLAYPFAVAIHTKLPWLNDSVSGLYELILRPYSLAFTS